MSEKKKGRLAALLATSEMPIAERERIEIVRVGRGRRVLLCGVRRILQYSAEKMMFALRQETVSVTGKELTCTAYADGAVSVCGGVQSISFTQEERQE